MITDDFVQRVIKAIEHNSNNYPSAKKQSIALGISAAQLSRIKKGDVDNVLSRAKWISIARKLDVRLSDDRSWNTARTPVFDYLYSQFNQCRDFGLSGLLCDSADIGKTFTAQQYAREHSNVAYIDCSQVKTKQLLLRKIAKEFGVQHEGRYADVYNDLVWYIQSISGALIILDEAGDLNYNAFLEIKALWNATERRCGWYMLGADALKAKIERYKGLKKVGYEELFSRFGGRFQRVTPSGSEDRRQFNQKQAYMVAQANGGDNLKELWAKTLGSLRRVHIELSKG